MKIKWETPKKPKWGAGGVRYADGYAATLRTASRLRPSMASLNFS